MTQPQSPRDADIRTGVAFEIPVLKLNRFPQVSSGAELSNQIMESFRLTNPDIVHEDYRPTNVRELYS